MTYYIYILYSPGSDLYDVGQTHDPEARLRDHNHGERPNQNRKFTFKHRPWISKAIIPVGEDRSMAVRMERAIKQKKTRRFIEEVISVAENESDPHSWLASGLMQD